MYHFLTYEGLEAYDSKIKGLIDEKSAEGLTEDEVLAIINGVDLEANYIEFTVANRSASNDKKAYRYSSGDIAGSNNAKTLCFSEVDGTKYYCAYDGADGAWTEGTTKLTEGDSIYSDSACTTSVSTIETASEGFLYGKYIITNGTWNPAYSDNNTKVIVEGDITLSGKTDCYSITFGNSGHLTINAGARLRIWQGGITNNDCGSVEYFTLKANAVNDTYSSFLIHPNVTANIHPKATVEFTSKSYTDAQTAGNFIKQRFGIPTMGAVDEISATGVVDNDYVGFQQYNYTTKQWELLGWLNHSTTTSPLVPAVLNKPFVSYLTQSFRTSSEDATIITMKGSLVGNDNVSITLQQNAWNSFANSFMSPIKTSVLLSILAQHNITSIQVGEDFTVVDSNNVTQYPYIQPIYGLFLIENSGSQFNLVLDYETLVWNPSFEEEVTPSVQTRGLQKGSIEKTELPDDPIFQEPAIDWDEVEPQQMR